MRHAQPSPQSLPPAVLSGWLQDDQPITVKHSVRSVENPLWEAANKLKRLISDIEEVAMINASHQRTITAE